MNFAKYLSAFFYQNIGWFFIAIGMAVPIGLAGYVSYAKSQERLHLVQGEIVFKKEFCWVRVRATLPNGGYDEQIVWVLKEEWDKHKMGDNLPVLVKY